MSGTKKKEEEKPVYAGFPSESAEAFSKAIEEFARANGIVVKRGGKVISTPKVDSTPEEKKE
jgi:hypothetical protein